METILIELPESSYTDVFEVRMMVAGGLYERGKLSAGQAATIVGISKRAFIEILGKFGYSIFGYSSTELESDMQTLAQWKQL